MKKLPKMRKSLLFICIESETGAGTPGCNMRRPEAVASVGIDVAWDKGLRRTAGTSPVLRKVYTSDGHCKNPKMLFSSMQPVFLDVYHLVVHSCSIDESEPMSISSKLQEMALLSLDASSRTSLPTAFDLKFTQ